MFPTSLFKFLYALYFNLPGTCLGNDEFMSSKPLYDEFNLPYPHDIIRMLSSLCSYSIGRLRSSLVYIRQNIRYYNSPRSFRHINENYIKDSFILMWIVLYNLIT